MEARWTITADGVGGHGVALLIGTAPIYGPE
jgi:hypothetical protein